MSQTDNTLSRKVERSIKLLRSIPADSPVEIAYSGDKDSDVILSLAQMAGIPFEPIYTTFYHHLHDFFDNKPALLGSEIYRSMLESYFNINLPG